MAGARVLRWWVTAMGLTAVEIEREDAERQTFTIDLSTAEKLSIAEGASLSAETIAILERTNRILAYIQRLQRFLSVRLRCTGDVIKKLRALGATEEDIRAVVAYLTEHAILNDDRFARAFVREQLRFGTLSARGIYQKLVAKGISPPIASQAIADEYPQDEMMRAQDTAQKALRRNRSHPRDVQYRRVRDTLLRRGYSGEIVRRVLAILFDTPEERSSWTQ